MHKLSVPPFRDRGLTIKLTSPQQRAVSLFGSRGRVQLLSRHLGIFDRNGSYTATSTLLSLRLGYLQGRHGGISNPAQESPRFPRVCAKSPRIKIFQDGPGPARGSVGPQLQVYAPTTRSEGSKILGDSHRGLPRVAPVNIGSQSPPYLHNLPIPTA